jgi:hypothetical protein
VSPDQFRAWQGIFRDIVITVLAAFMLVWQCVFAAAPNIYIIGAGVTLLGVPPALRLDSLRRRNEDPYDGPGGYFRE